MIQLQAQTDTDSLRVGDRVSWRHPESHRRFGRVVSKDAWASSYVVRFDGAELDTRIQAREITREGP